MDVPAYAPLEALLGWSFRDTSLIERSLTHRSYCAEHLEAKSNERLEFLGDAVLGLIVTDTIFRSYPQLPEGELAKLRAAVVNADTLAELAAEIDLGSYLRLGKGEDLSGGRTKTSILADAMEAVLAAVYLDGGREVAERAVLGLLEARITDAAAGPGGHDYKTRLQELAARRFDQLPRYKIRHEGPDHDKRFYATVALGGDERGAGEGRSKKQAEQAAARAAWLWLRGQEPTGAKDRADGETEALVPSRGGHDA